MKRQQIRLILSILFLTSIAGCNKLNDKAEAELIIGIK